MKKLKTLLIAGFFLIAANTFAQTAQPAQTPSAKKEVKAKPASGGVKTKKDGTPDKRYSENQKLKADGTPDKRYSENKKLKADGTPDKRYSENKNLKKDGTPDKRYKTAKADTVKAAKKKK
ncbi:hypothetical protein [Dyadobacter sp. 32]|uniref:hypothetical protein n=1 Tax=Dyadobacter sp. 32 TaxID=538966 RepID=UPI0011ED81CC